MVTAAVYRGLGSLRKQLSLTFQHRAGVRLYTSNFFLAEPCVFDKQSPLLIMCHPPKVSQKQVPLLPKLRG